VIIEIRTRCRDPVVNSIKIFNNLPYIETNLLLNLKCNTI